jgi:hypothetical protein
VIVILPADSAAGDAPVVVHNAAEIDADACPRPTCAHLFPAESVMLLTTCTADRKPTAICSMFPAVVVTPENTSVVAFAVSVAATD